VEGSGEATNVWRKLEIEVLNAAKAAAARGERLKGKRNMED
jgi:hypothetical protein